MEKLRGMKENEIHGLVFQKGVNLARTPLWERRGIMVHRREGLMFQNWELPLFDSQEGEQFIAGQLAGSRQRSRD
jgi:tRNA(His) 5'-end guanylyltransferase